MNCLNVFLIFILFDAMAVTQDFAPQGGGLLHSVLESAGLSEERAADLALVLEPLVGNTFFYELLDAANKASVAHGLEAAAQAVKRNPSDQNLRAFGEAYKAKADIQRYELFLSAARRFVPEHQFDRPLPVNSGVEGESSVREPQDKTSEHSVQAMSDVVGVSVEALTSKKAADLDLYPGSRGMLVVSVAADSPAAVSGIEPGMVIESIQYRVVFDIAAFQTYVGRLTEHDQPVMGLWVRRGEKWERRSWIVALHRKGSPNPVPDVAKVIKQRQTPPPPGVPQWLNEVAQHPIIPGESMAGLRIGDSEDKIRDRLGKGWRNAHPIHLVEGNKLDGFAFNYKYENMSLGVFTQADTRRIRGFRLSDDNFNAGSYLPRLANELSIGSTGRQLLQIMGLPPKITNHLRWGGAAGYHYDGISFHVCEENDTVGMIDITIRK